MGRARFGGIACFHWQLMSAISGPPLVVAGCNAQARIMIVAVSYKGYYLMEQARRCATDTPFPPVPKFSEVLPLTRSGSFCLL